MDLRKYLIIIKKEKPTMLCEVEEHRLFQFGSKNNIFYKNQEKFCCRYDKENDLYLSNDKCWLSGNAIVIPLVYKFVNKEKYIEYLKKLEEKKEKKRKYKKGERIKTIEEFDEVIKNNGVLFLHNVAKHTSFLQNLQYHYIKMMIYCGNMYKAIKKTEDDNKKRGKLNG